MQNCDIYYQYEGMMDNLDYIGAKIKEIRKRKKISQEALAEKISMNYRSIVRIENHHTLPTIETLNKIAEALDVDIVCFFEPIIFNSKEEVINKIDNMMQGMEFEKLKKFYKTFSYFSNL